MKAYYPRTQIIRWMIKTFNVLTSSSASYSMRVCVDKYDNGDIDLKARIRVKSQPKDDAGLPAARRTGRGASLFFFIGFIMASLATVVIYYFFGDERRDGMEFACYILPSIAGICGGIGLFYKDIERSMFWASGFALVVSFAIYIADHTDSFLTTWACVAAVVLLMAMTLFFMVIRRPSVGVSKAVRGFEVALSVCLLMVSGIAVFYFSKNASYLHDCVGSKSVPCSAIYGHHEAPDAHKNG